ncbi:MAG: hypothetical protein ABIB71_06930 [Candidatus Woesearchaeota archaeon]
MVALHLNRNVDDIFSGYSKLETPEERMEHKVEGSLMFEGFEELMKAYEEVISIKNLGKTQTNEKIVIELPYILTPKEINTFLQSTVRYEDYENYGWNTGFFLTSLIQNSYNHGNTKFLLNTKTLSKEINSIGNSLKGKKNKIIELSIRGDVGDCCGSNAEHINLSVEGNAGDCCGSSATNSILNISGDVGWGCGAYNAQHSTFTILGMAATNDLAVFTGRSGGLHGNFAEKCIFKTSNKKTLQLLIYDVTRGNEIYLIKPNGKEKKVHRAKDIFYAILGKY